MNKPGLFAAMLAVAAPGASAQQEQPCPPPAQACPGADDAARASGALPARATVEPAPQLGSVAPANRVLSHTVTPSLRAMRAASEKEAARAPDPPRDPGTECVPRTGQLEPKKR